MKKKTSIRDQREQQAAKMRLAHQQKEAVRQETVRAQREAEEAAAREKERIRQAAQKAVRLKELNNDPNYHPIRQRSLSEEKKSTAKAAGLKSTFIMGEKDLLMTSFGKGNAAVVEKKIAAGEVSDLTDKPAFTAVAEKDISFRIDGRVKNASTDNPLHIAEEKTKTREDLIHARSSLEMLYYGENFEDNIKRSTVSSMWKRSCPFISITSFIC